MSDETVQTLDVIVAAEATHMFTTTDDLMVQVALDAHCLESTDPTQWQAPAETHPNMLQHRWDERTEMIAARLCAPCPVKDACLAAAQRLPGYYAAWIRGGLTPKQRRLELVDATETAGEGR